MDSLLSDLKVAQTMLRASLVPIATQLIEVINDQGWLSEIEEREANSLIDDLDQNPMRYGKRVG